MKMTKSNYERIIADWVEDIHRDVHAIYHGNQISFSEITDYAFGKNITIGIKTNETPFVDVYFKEELIDYEN